MKIKVTFRDGSVWYYKGMFEKKKKILLTGFESHAKNYDPQSKGLLGRICHKIEEQYKEHDCTTEYVQ